MKVKELIEVLQKLNPETEIAIEDAEGETAFWITRYRNKYILNGEDYQLLPDNLAKKIVDQNNVLCSAAPVSATRRFTKYPVNYVRSNANAISRYSGSASEYVVMVRNRGMWGYATYCKDEQGRPMKFSTREQAQAVADRYNSDQGPVNNFNHYYVEEW